MKFEESLTAAEIDFDPLMDIFTAQAKASSEQNEMNLRTLSPYQRALLVIDGTVTKFIEAYTMEPVKIVLLEQETRTLNEDHEWLEAPSGSEVIARQVLLKGKYSEKVYAYAFSLIAKTRLGENVKHGLDVDSGGIGRVLLNNQIENRREILWYGKENAENLPDAVRNILNTDVLSRSYRIISNGKPIMLINEKFPWDEGLLPSQY